MRERISTDNASKLVEITQTKAGWIKQVLWSPNGSMLAVASGDEVRLYAGTFGGAPTHVLKGHTAPIKSIAFDWDGKTLVSVSADTQVRLWNVAEVQMGVQEIAVLEGHTDSVEGVAFSPSGKHLITVAADGWVCLWSGDDYQERTEFSGHETEATDVDFAMRGTLFVTSGRDRTVRLWDTGGEIQGAIIGTHDDWVRGICVNPPGTMVASASRDSTVRLWDVQSGEQFATIQAHADGADCVTFNNYGELIATGGRDNLVRLWHMYKVINDNDVSMDGALMTLEGHSKPVLSVSFNPAGTILATASGDNTVRLWGVARE